MTLSERVVAVGWQPNDPIPGAIKFWAACEDERTEAVLIVGEGNDPTATSIFQSMTSEEGQQMLVIEHLARCESCQRIKPFAITPRLAPFDARA